MSRRSDSRNGSTPYRKAGFEVTVETGAGDLASFPDESYRSAGCKIADTSSQIWGECDIVLKVRSPSDEEIEQLRPDTTDQFPGTGPNPDLLKKIAARGASAIAIEAVPRISRAQNRCTFIDGQHRGLPGSR